MNDGLDCSALWSTEEERKMRCNKCEIQCICRNDTQVHLFLLREYFCWIWCRWTACVDCFRLCHSFLLFIFLSFSIPLFHPLLLPYLWRGLLGSPLPRRETVNLSRDKPGKVEVMYEGDSGGFVCPCLFNAKDGSSHLFSTGKEEEEKEEEVVAGWQRLQLPFLLLKQGEKWHNGNWAQVTSLGHWYPWN